MNTKKALALLGLPEGATIEEIKKAYRSKAMEFHPDKNPGNTQAEEKFKEINSAYEYLTKPTSRQKENSFTFEDFADLGSMFEDFFHGFNRKQTKTRQMPPPTEVPINLGDLNIGVVSVNLLNILFKEPINLALHVNAVCKACLVDSGSWIVCSACNKTGHQIKNHRTPFGMASQAWECSACKGRGWIRKKHCKVCKDRLIFSKEKNINVILPKNSIGQVVRMQGNGHENWKCADGPVMFVPQLKNIDLDLLSKEEMADLKKILAKAVS